MKYHKIFNPLIIFIWLMPALEGEGKPGHMSV